MGTCKYCGKSTGLFSSSHKECEQRHQEGVEALNRSVGEYFAGKMSVAELTTKVRSFRRDNFLKTEDVAACAGKGLDSYTNAIHRPFSQGHIDMVMRFVAAMAEPYCELDKGGAITRFGQKLIKGYIAGYFANGEPLQLARQQVAQLTQAIPIPQDKVQDALFYMLNKAADNFSKDGQLTGQEIQLIDNYTMAFNLQMNNLPAAYQGSNIEKVSQTTLLNNLQQGKLPQNSGIQLPILLGKGEALLWAYNGVTFYLEKVEKEFVGQHSGFSFRVAKGVTYRVGGSKGHPIEHSHMENMGKGTLYLTNKNMIYYSSTKSVKIPYAKLIGVTPYSDGIEVHKDGATKRMTFQGFDSWFIMNLLSIINNL